MKSRQKPSSRLSEWGDLYDSVHSVVYSSLTHFWSSFFPLLVNFLYSISQLLLGLEYFTHSSVHLLALRFGANFIPSFVLQSRFSPESELEEPSLPTLLGPQ